MSMFIPLAGGRMARLACSLLCSLSAESAILLKAEGKQRFPDRPSQRLPVSLGNGDGKKESGKVPAGLITSVTPVFPLPSCLCRSIQLR